MLAGFGGQPHSVLGEVGVLQQTLITRACQALAGGQADVVLVVGGEDKERQRQAARAGLAPATAHPVDDRVADEVWRPEGEILTAVEIERDLAVPTHQYAMIEQALAHADGRDDAARDARLGALWSSFAAVAASRPDAWDRSAPSPAEIVTVSAANRMLATPYTRRLCSQWNVDQAAALVLTTVAEADRRGLPRSRWVFPWAAAESNAMIPLARPGRAPPLTGGRPGRRCAGRGARRAGLAALDRPGRPLQLLPGGGGRAGPGAGAGGPGALSPSPGG